MMNPIDQKSEMSTSSQKNFEVRFQRNCRTYFGGEDVVGFVDIDYKTWTDVNQISLLFRGETLACWQDNENGDGSSQNTIRAHRCHWKEPILITSDFLILLLYSTGQNLKFIHFMLKLNVGWSL